MKTKTIKSVAVALLIAITGMAQTSEEQYAKALKFKTAYNDFFNKIPALKIISLPYPDDFIAAATLEAFLNANIIAIFLVKNFSISFMESLFFAANFNNVFFARTIFPSIE